jgi:hypothetical protein
MKNGALEGKRDVNEYNSIVFRVAPRPRQVYSTVYSMRQRQRHPPIVMLLVLLRLLPQRNQIP